MVDAMMIPRRLVLLYPIHDRLGGRGLGFGLWGLGIGVWGTNDGGYLR